MMLLLAGPVYATPCTCPWKASAGPVCAPCCAVSCHACGMAASPRSWVFFTADLCHLQGHMLLRHTHMSASMVCVRVCACDLLFAVRKRALYKGTANGGKQLGKLFLASCRSWLPMVRSTSAAARTHLQAMAMRTLPQLLTGTDQLIPDYSRTQPEYSYR